MVSPILQTPLVEVLQGCPPYPSIDNTPRNGLLPENRYLFNLSRMVRAMYLDWHHHSGWSMHSTPSFVLVDIPDNNVTSPP